MGSAPTLNQTNKGIDDRSIKLGCVQPGESPATFGDALRRLATKATYLVEDHGQYWYSLGQTIGRSRGSSRSTRTRRSLAGWARSVSAATLPVCTGRRAGPRRFPMRWRRGWSCSGRIIRTPRAPR